MIRHAFALIVQCNTCVPGSSRQGVGTVLASSNFAASHHYESRDQYFPRLHHVTRGAHTLSTSKLCLWGCGSRGCISLVCTVFKLKYFVNGHINYELVHFESGVSFFFFQFYFLLFYPIVSQNLCIGKVRGPTSTGDMHNEYFKNICEWTHQ